MFKLLTVLTLLTASSAFVPQSFTAHPATSLLRMSDIDCPEIPTTAMLDPKFDTAIIALG